METAIKPTKAKASHATTKVVIELSDSEAPSEVSEDSFFDIDDFDSDTGEYLLGDLPQAHAHPHNHPRTDRSGPDSPEYIASRNTKSQISSGPLSMRLRSRM